MVSSLKKNIAYKGFLTFANYIIGFVTFPYVTRILGPANFGLVNFVQNTIDYFLLFATMGISTIGTREIAAAKGNPSKLNKTYSSIFGLNVLFTVFTLVVYLLCVWHVPRFNQNQELFYIGTAKIIFALFAIEWLFTGLENFKFITIRSLLIRTFYVVTVFLFVRESDDYILYFALSIGVVVVNSIINFLYGQKFVSIIWRYLFSSQFLTSSLRLGLYTIMTSMYITYNVMYLGLVSDDSQVGYYTTAVKLYFIAVSLFGAFTAVMMPRMSALMASNDKIAIQSYFTKSMNLVFLTALPIIILSEFFTPQIIDIMSGDGYQLSILPMRILMPALLLVWISQVIAFQTFIPLRKDAVLLAASIIGGVLAIILNICITPILNSVGSAITLLACEIAVSTFYIATIIRKRILYFPFIKDFSKYILLTLPYAVICITSVQFLEAYPACFVSVFCSVLYFFMLKPLKRLKA